MAASSSTTRGMSGPLCSGRGRSPSLVEERSVTTSRTRCSPPPSRSDWEWTPRPFGRVCALSRWILLVRQLFACPPIDLLQLVDEGEHLVPLGVYMGVWETVERKPEKVTKTGEKFYAEG